VKAYEAMNDVLMGNTVVALIRNDNGVYSWHTDAGGCSQFKSLIECLQHCLDVQKAIVISVPEIE
jgi:hypothetical protein